MKRVIQTYLQWMMAFVIGMMLATGCGKDSSSDSQQDQTQLEDIEIEVPAEPVTSPEDAAQNLMQLSANTSYEQWEKDRSHPVYWIPAEGVKVSRVRALTDGIYAVAVLPTEGEEPAQVHQSFYPKIPVEGHWLAVTVDVKAEEADAAYLELNYVQDGQTMSILSESHPGDGKIHSLGIATMLPRGLERGGFRARLHVAPGATQAVIYDNISAVVER